MFCKYRNILGVPKEGIHKYRLFGFAIADVLMTIIGALVISFFTKITYWKVLLTLFISGIVLHRIFCVQTTLDKILFS